MLASLNFSAIFTGAGMAKLGQIIVGDLTMAGDNVVIMGSVASGLPARDRRKVLMLGVGMALVFLITSAVLATQLLQITGLVFAGGLLLLWVAYNLVREMVPSPVGTTYDDPDMPSIEGPPATKTFWPAAIHGFGANYVAKLIQKYDWINYIGLAVILYVAVTMTYEGWAGGEHVLGLRAALHFG
jgi:predicted tellurium resistance membrane protein TerC